MQEMGCIGGRELKKYKGGTEAIQVVIAGSKCKPLGQEEQMEENLEVPKRKLLSWDPDL